MGSGREPSLSLLTTVKKLDSDSIKHATVMISLCGEPNMDRGMFDTVTVKLFDCCQKG